MSFKGKFVSLNGQNVTLTYKKGRRLSFFMDKSVTIADIVLTR